MPLACAINVSVLPHTCFAWPLTLTTGAELTVTISFAVSLAQTPLPALTQYVAENAGSIIIVSLVPPVLHTYPVPPPAVKVSAIPEHSVLLPVIVAAGGVSIVTITDAEFLQLPLVPVTV